MSDNPVELVGNYVAGGGDKVRKAFDEICDDLVAVDEERHKLRELFEHVCRLSWSFGDIDGGDVQDEAERLGLLVQVPGDAAFIELFGDDEMMYVWPWSDAARAEEGK